MATHPGEQAMIAKAVCRKLGVAQNSTVRFEHHGVMRAPVSIDAADDTGSVFCHA